MSADSERALSFGIAKIDEAFPGFHKGDFARDAGFSGSHRAEERAAAETGSTDVRGAGGPCDLGRHPTKDNFSGEREVEIYVQAIDATKKCPRRPPKGAPRYGGRQKITCASQLVDEEPEKTVTVEKACGS